MGYQTHLADTLRSVGLTVIEVPGWETRGGFDFDPRGVVLHHTATAGTADKLLRDGRTGLSGPLCNWSTERDGRVKLFAAGTANHAGRDWSGNPARLWTPPGTRNRHVYGDEAINTGVGQEWPAVQLDSMVLAAAAVSRHHGWAAEHTVAHFEWAGRRKIDPAFIAPRLTMDQLRNRISLVLHRPSPSRPEPDGDQPMTITEYLEWIYWTHNDQNLKPDYDGRMFWTGALGDEKGSASWGRADYEASTTHKRIIYGFDNP